MNSPGTEEPKIPSFRNDFPLHFMAKMGDSAEMEQLLQTRPDELFRKDFVSRSPLHYAVLCENLKEGSNCVKIILDYLSKAETQNKSNFKQNKVKTRRIRGQAWKADDVGVKTKDFIDLKDLEGESALSLAAQNENPEIVQNLLLKSADVLTRNKKGEMALHFIYMNTPSALTALLSKSVTFDYGETDYDMIKNERRYALDLTAIVGNYDESQELEGGKSFKSDILVETELLYSVNTKKVNARKEILKHPLVRYFIERKTQNFKILSYILVALYFCWVCFYSWYAIDVFYSCCDTVFQEEKKLYCSHYPDWNNSVIFENINETDKLQAKWEIEDCVSNKDRIIRPLIILIFTALILVKELFQFRILKKEYLKLDNILVWIFSVFLILTVLPISTSTGTHVYLFVERYQIAAFGLLTGAMVLLELINKLIYWAIYIKVLIQVTKRFIAILPLFFFIMLAFSLSLRMIFPDRIPSITLFRDSIMVIFETIANGKIEWISGPEYKVSVDNNFPVAGLLLFITFYVIISLLLFRILIGFVVADTKKIQEEEEMNEFSENLDEIYIFESLLASKLFYFAKRFPFWARIKKRFLICSSDSIRNLQIKLYEKEIPKNLRKDIRVLASKNIVVKKPKLIPEIKP